MRTNSRPTSANSRTSIELKHSGLALFFDSPNAQRDGKCVAFYQPGPTVVNHGGEAAPHRSWLRDYYMRGWICAAPGQTLTNDTAYDLIKSFKVTP